MGISGTTTIGGIQSNSGLIPCSQIDEVLSKDSAEELDKGNNPGPMTEIQFWKAKCENLESLYDQVYHDSKSLPNKFDNCVLQMKENTTKKMASILNITNSAYYPSFKYLLIISCHYNNISHTIGQCSEMFSQL